MVYIFCSKYICSVIKLKKMKNKFIVLGILFASLSFTKVQAQINFGEKAIGAVQKGVASFTLTLSLIHI